MRKLVLFSIAALMMAPAANAQVAFNDITYNEVVNSYGRLADKPYNSEESRLKWVANWVNTTCASKKWGAKKKCALAWGQINKGLAEKRAKEASEKAN
jgi:hypothetical protein